MGKMKHEFEKLEKNGPEDITDMMPDDELEVYMESMPANKLETHRLRNHIIKNMEMDSTIMDLSRARFKAVESEIKKLKDMHNEIMLTLESVHKKLDESS